MYVYRVLLVLLLVFAVGFANAQENCNCAPVVKNTVEWCVSAKGNEYCFRITRTGKEVKEYKKYYGEKPPTSISCPTTHIWKQSKRSGKWYKTKKPQKT